MVNRPILQVLLEPSRLRRWMKIWLLGLALLSAVLQARAASLGAGGASIPFSHRVWTMDDGLPQDFVATIQVSSDGLLWGGTQEGLVRFDGLQFRVFDSGNSSAFQENNVQALAETKDGTLWIGTTNGLIRRPTGGDLVLIASAQGMPATFISSLYTDNQGRLWVGTGSMGAFVLDAGQFHPLIGMPLDCKLDCNIWQFAETEEGLWIGTDPQGLFLHEPKTSIVQHVTGLPAGPISALFADSSGDLWVSVGELGVWVHRKTDPPLVFQPIDDLRLKGATVLALDPKGRMWIGTAEHGLFIQEGGSIQAVWVDGASPQSILSVAFDQEGTAWVGTRAAGLHQFREGPIAAVTSRQGLADDQVLTVCEDRDGVIWAGGADGRITRIQQGHVSIHTLPGERHWITSVTPRAQGGIWVGTRGGGLHALDRDGRPIRLPETVHDRVPARITALIEDETRTLWIGSREDGLATVSFQAPVLVKKVQNVPPVGTLTLGPNGQVLIGTYNSGLGILDRDSVRFLGKKEGLAVENIRSILSMNGRVWVATSGGGLARLDQEQGQFTTWRARDGLFIDGPQEMLQDDMGRLWVGSNQGLFYVHPQDLHPGKRVTSVPFGREDGMPSAECNASSAPSAWRARDGKLWFATTGGLAIVDPARLPLQQPAPRVLVDRVLSEDKVIESGSTVSLRKGGGRLTVQYLAASLSEARRLVYRYRLTGFDEGWVEAKSRREAFYTNIPPGTYTFEVQAHFLGHEDQVSETKLAIVVPAFYYQTLWFRISLALAGACLVAVLVGWRIVFLRQRNAELAAMVEVRTGELAQANDALSGANEALSAANQTLLEKSHTDPLTGLKNRRFLLSNIGADLALVHRLHKSQEEAHTNDNIDLLFLMVDIDHFKEINDRFGHAAGDRVLEQIRDILLASCRSSDTPVRWGGEEFLVVGRFMDHRFASVFAERIRSMVANHLFDLGNGQTLHRTCSIGFASYPFFPQDIDRLNWEEVVNLADHCLYAAKHSGRNAWVGARSTEQDPGWVFNAVAVRDLTSLVEDGYLHVETSLGDATGLQWE